MINFLEKNKVFLVYIPLIIYWIVLLVATSLPAQDLPRIETNDKFTHFAAYFILSVMLNFSLMFQNKLLKLKNNPALWTIIIGFTYGAFDEIHQYFIPGRFCEFLDWIANAVGVLFGVFSVQFLFKIEERHKKKSH